MYENIDRHLIYGFLNSGMGISYRNASWYESSKYPYASEKIQMGNYLKLMGEDDKFITKHHLPKHGWGRTQCENHLSLNVFYRPTRHKLCLDKYVDIDMISAHPKIFLMFAQAHGLKCDILKRYIDEPLKMRNELLKFHYGFDLNKLGMSCEDKIKYKDIAKTLPLILCYGGSYNTWIKENEVPNDKKRYSPFLELQSEVTILMDAVFKANPLMLADLKKNKPLVGGIHAEKRTVFAMWAQTIERMILENVCEYLSSKFDMRYIVPCQDGLMILKEHYYDGIISDINKHVLDTLGWGIEFDIKAFDQACEIPIHNSLKVKPQLINDDETDYFNLPELSYFELDQKKLDIGYDQFEEADTFLVQSGTGTGKSTLIAKLCKEYKEKHKGTKILCLASLRSILCQLTKTFKDFSIELADYRNYIGDLSMVDSTMCINSLLKILGCDFSNTVLYIDEPINLLLGMCGNTTIHETSSIVSEFIKLIKTCRKLIFTDAHVMQSMQKLIDLRGNGNDSVYYYVNSHKKFEGTIAYELEDQRDLVKEAEKRIKSETPFIFCSDSKSKADAFYKLCYDIASDAQRKKFVLITAHTKVDITKVDYNSSYVFMSPTIVCGLSIINESSSDTLMYITGKTLNPISLYQQCTRNRTMNNLYFYVSPKNKHVTQFNSYKSCVAHYAKICDQVTCLSDLCSYMDDSGDIVFANNFYFNLYTQKEYSESIMFQDIAGFFKNELINAGFVIECVKGIDGSAHLKEYSDSHKEDVCFDLIESIKEKYSDKTCGDLYVERCRKLKIKNKAELEMYINLVTDDKAYASFFTFEKYIQPLDDVSDIVGKLASKKHALDVSTSNAMKVYLLKQFETSLKLKPLEIGKDFTCEIPKKGTNKLLHEVKSRFRLTNGSLSTVDDCKTLYIKLLRNIFNGFDFIDSNRVGSGKNGDRVRVYNINFDQLKKYTNVLFTMTASTDIKFDKSILKYLYDHCGKPELLSHHYCSIPVDVFKETE